MLTSSNFWYGVIITLALQWAWRRFGSGLMAGKNKGQQ